jgi:hypothetical protein
MKKEKVIKAADPKLSDTSKVTKADLFIEAIRLTEPRKKSEFKQLKDDITQKYFLLQELAKEQKLI